MITAEMLQTEFEKECKRSIPPFDSGLSSYYMAYCKWLEKKYMTLADDITLLSSEIKRKKGE